MKLKMLGIAVVGFAVGLATIPASAVTVTVEYSGLITNGYDTNGFFSPPATSLTGVMATIDFVFRNVAVNSSSVVVNSTSDVTAVIRINNGGPFSGISFGFTPDGAGTATDQAVVGSTQQSIWWLVPTSGDYGQIQASASDPSITASLTQPLTVSDINLDIFFSMHVGYCSDFCDFYGYISSGSLTISNDIPKTPLPAALPLFATGLGALGLLARRRKRKKLAA